MPRTTVIHSHERGLNGADGDLTEATADGLYGGLANVTRLDTVVYDVTKAAYGAVANGTTDDVAAIATAQVAAAAVATANVRTTLALAAGKTHKIGQRVGSNAFNGGVFLERGVNLDGQGATLLIDSNSAFITNRWSTYSGNNGSGAGATLQTVITANVAVAATTFTVASTTGFSVGDDVHVRLNDNAWDVIEAKDTYFAKVLTVGSGTSLTLDRPSPAACTVASTDAANKVIQRLPEVWDGGFIRNLTLINPMGTPNAESGIDLRYARGTVIDGITADHPGAGALLLAYCRDIEARNFRIRKSDKQNDQASKGRVLNLWNSKNIRLVNWYAEMFEGAVGMIESYARGVVLENWHIVNNHPDRVNATTALFVVNQGSEAHIKTLTVEGNGGTALVDYSGTTGNIFSVENLTINTVTQMLYVPLTAVSGSLQIGSTVYERFRTQKFRISLNPSIAGEWLLPVGLYRRVSVLFSSMTGITNVYVQNTAGQGPEITADLNASVGVAVNIPNLGAYGSDYPFNNVDTKKIAIYGGATVPTTAWAELEIEWWPTIADDNNELQVLNPTTLTASSTLTVDATWDADAATVVNNQRTRLDEMELVIKKMGGWVA